MGSGVAFLPWLTAFPPHAGPGDLQGLRHEKKPSGMGQGEHVRPRLAPPFGLSFSVSPFIYSSFHVSVFSLLHAMAVVLHADETVRGTTAGSHFSGNF